MERIKIPNPATYSPVALTDVTMLAPLVSRLLLGATLPGRIVSTAALGAYAGSAAIDFMRRSGARKIDFLQVFGADVNNLTKTPAEVRESDVERLVGELNEIYRPMDVPRRELAVRVDQHLTDYIAGITGQRIETSTQIRSFMVAGLLFPFALGAADPLTGDVAIFKKTGVFEPHVIAHEFSHRKGYFKELEAQALAYLSLAGSGDDVLVQAAYAERLDRQLWVLCGDDSEKYNERIETSELREELRSVFHVRRGVPRGYEKTVGSFARDLYDMRMQLTGQNGISDYDRGFTDFLYTVEQAAV